MTYRFEQVSGGFRYNLLKRCLHEVGIEPIGCHDEGEETVVIFDRELTEYENKKLQFLMKDNPTFPPKRSNHIFRIVDIGEWIDYFNKATGIEFHLYCNHLEDIDVLELHTNDHLTWGQVQNVRTQYSKLML